MRLYKTKAHDAAPGSIRNYVEFTSSAGDASKVRTRLKKLGLTKIETVELDVNTDRQSLIRFLNGMMAHDSWKVEAVANKLQET